MRVLTAGDHFVSNALLADALRTELGETKLEIAELTLPWPHEPFGPVGTVHEASGTEDQVIAALGNAEAVATEMAPFTDRVLAADPELRLVAVARGGPVNVDLAAATRRGIAVTFTPGRNAAAAAEYAVGLMLAAMRRITVSDAGLKAGRWRGDLYAYEEAGTELDGSTVGLVGYGAIGRIVARVLTAFGAHVLVADPYVDPSAIAADGIELVPLEDLLRRSRVVSLHARLTESTRNLIDADKLALLPDDAVLVNTARGGLLDYAAVTAALRSGRLGGLALDVYDVEPPPEDWPLRDLPNVVATSHLAGATRETAHRAARIVAAEVGRLSRGEPLLHLANPDVGAGRA